MNFGYAQNTYTIRYENGQSEKRLPKYIKFDTLKINNNIQSELRSLHIKLTELGYFLNEVELNDSNKLCLVHLGSKFNDIILTDSIDIDNGIFNKVKYTQLFKSKTICSVFKKQGQ